jgi:GGDEF domain-containing protein
MAGQSNIPVRTATVGRIKYYARCIQRILSPPTAVSFFSPSFRAVTWAASPTATEGGPVGVTISVGVTELEPGDQDPNHILARVDRALYRAKESGRNRVELELAP